MRSRFLYTLSNNKLRYAKRRLKIYPGLYLFFGESGTGKTTYLKDVFGDKNALWLSAEKMKQMMLDDILGKTNISVGEHKYVVIDNIEDISGEALLQRFAKIIDSWVDEGIVVAMTECSTKASTLPTRNSIRSFKVKSVFANPRVVRRYAALIGMKIPSDVAEIIAESCPYMNSVPNMILRYFEDKL